MYTNSFYYVTVNYMVRATCKMCTYSKYLPLYEMSLNTCYTAYALTYTSQLMDWALAVSKMSISQRTLNTVQN